MLYCIILFQHVADDVSRSSGTGRQRDHHPAGHRTRGHGARLGVRVHGCGRRAWSQDGRIRHGGRSSGHRPVAGSATLLGNVHNGATTSVLPGRGHRCLRASTISTSTDPTAAQDHRNSDPVAVDSKLSATVRCSQILDSQGRPGFAGAGTRYNDRANGADIEH